MTLPEQTVHFTITGRLKIEAKSPADAETYVREYLNKRWELSDLLDLGTGLVVKLTAAPR